MSITTLTEEFIKKARLKLSSNKYRFFGLCLYPIRINSVTKNENIEGWINYDGNKFENQININEKMIDTNSDRYKTLNMIDILLHELNHILRRHDVRKGNRNPELWNIACDHVIDMSLRRLILSSPLVQYNILKQIEFNEEIQSEEEVYDWLIKNNYNKFEINKKDDGKIEYHSYSDPSYNDFEVYPDLSPTPITSGEKQVIEDYVSQIRAVYNIEKEKGSISGSLIDLFDVLLKVEVPWEKILEKAIKTKYTTKANRHSWRRLNKYYVGLNISLPGYVKSSDKTDVSVLIVHIDSSGSVSKDDLRKAGHVIVRSAQYFDKIILIIADTTIKQEVIFRNREYDKIESYFKDCGITGRGGTSHREVFKYFDKVYEENPDSLSMCISITDMYSDIEVEIDKAKFIKVVPLVLINTSNKRIIKNSNVTTIICSA